MPAVQFLIGEASYCIVQKISHTIILQSHGKVFINIFWLDNIKLDYIFDDYTNTLFCSSVLNNNL